MVVPWEVHPAIVQGRCGCLEPIIILSSGTLLGQLEKGLEEQRGIEPIGIVMSGGQSTQSSHELDHQPRSIQGGIYDSRYQRIDLTEINGRGGPWSCGGLMPQHRGMLE